jgi:hypothetical protein
MRTISVVIAFAVAGFGAVGVLYWSNPLRQSGDLIREGLLRSKPIGTPISEVERWLAQEKKLHFARRNAGYRRSYPPPPTVVGVKSIEVNLGEYRTVFVTSVEVYWGFDSKDELIDVWVRKTTDAL